MEQYSVLMSVYYNDNAQWFAEATKSMLNQTVPPSDFVIVCDGRISQDLEQAIQSFQQQYPELFQIVRNEKNQGLGLALQCGLGYCKFDWVARMDSDDISVPNRVEMLFAELERNPETNVIGGQIAEFVEDCSRPIGKRRVPLRHDEIAAMAKKRNPMNHVTVLLQKSAVMEAGNYLPLEKFEDYYLWARMLKAGFRFRNIDEICVYVRVNLQMYGRRGGISYFLQTKKLEDFLLQTNIISRKQWIQNLMVRFSGTVCVPSGLRKRIYQSFLRERE